MNKRRVISVMALVVVMVMAISLFTACGSDTGVVVDTGYYPENFTPVDYTGMQVVDGMDSFKLLGEVYDTWTEDKGYKRVQNFTFRANIATEGGAVAGKQDALDIYKIDGDKLYRQMVKIQTSVTGDPLNELTRFYYDGKNATGVVVNDTAVIPADPKADGGLFNIVSMPAMAGLKDTKAEIDADLKTYTSHMTTYTWRDKKNLANENYKVYKAEDGTYRFTIVIDCDLKTMKKAHNAAWKEFETATGADKDSIEMRENTTIDFVVGKVDGVKKILAWRRTEKYRGSLKGMPLILAKQCSVETFSYDEADYKITDADLA